MFDIVVKDNKNGSLQSAYGYNTVIVSIVHSHDDGLFKTEL